jgi:hypothetical protein
MPNFVCDQRIVTAGNTPPRPSVSAATLRPLAGRELCPMRIAGEWRGK